MADEFSLNAEMTLDTSGFINGLEQAQNAMSGFQSGMSDMSASMEGMEQSEEQGGKGLEGWGISLDTFTSKGSSLLKSFGLDVDILAAKFGMSAPLLAGIIAATVALEKLGAAMDEATSAIARGTGAVGKNLENMEQSLRTAMIDGVTLPAKELGGVLANINTYFGATGSELTKLTKDFDQFARVTGTDAKQAVDGVNTVLKKWGATTESTKALLNQLTKASQDSGLSVTELTSALESSRNTLSQFGMDISQSTAFLVNLKKNGIDSTQVLSSMKMGLAKFAQEGKEPKEAMKQLSEAIKNASSETEALQLSVEAFGSRGGAEMVQVFRSGAFDVEAYAESLNHVGNAMRDTDEASGTVKESMDKLKNTFMGTFGQLGQTISGLFKNIIDIVQNIMTVFSPVIDAIAGAIRKLVGGLGNAISKAVFYITDLVKRMNVQGPTIAKVLNAIGDVFSKVFSAIGGIMKWFHHTLSIIINKIKILILQFEKKLAPLLQPIIEKVTSFVNAILTGVNGFLEKIRNLAKKIGAEDIVPDNINLLVVQPLDKRIETINQQILDLTKENQELTADLKKKADSTIEYADSAYKTQEELLDQEGEYAEKVTGSVEEAVSKFEDLSKWEDKLLSQMISKQALEKENAVASAKNRKASAEEIAKIEKEYNDLILELKMEQINRQRKAELERVKDFENAKDAEAKINLYYDNQIAELSVEKIEEVKEVLDDRYKLEEQWTQKIEGQKSSMLDNERDLLLALAQTEEERNIINFDYAKKKHALEMELLEAERQSALLAVQGMPELEEQVNRYYDNEKLKLESQMKLREKAFNEQLDNEEELQSEQKKTWKDYVKNATDAIGKVSNAFGKIGKVMKSVMDGAVKIVRKSFSAITKIFTKLFNFNNDEMLDSLLAWEDKVLTFFTTGASQIPAFVSSVLQSVRVLTENILQSISDEGLGNAFENMIDNVVSELPAIISNIAKIFTKIFSQVVKSLSKNSKKIVSGVISVIKIIISELPTLLPMIAEGIVSILEAVTDVLAEMLTDDDQSNKLSDSIASVIQKLVESVLKNIPKALEILVGGLKTLIVALVKALVSIIKDTDWEAVWGEFKRIGGEFLSGIWEGIKNGAVWLWNKISGFFGDVWNWIDSFFSELWNKISGWFSEIWQNIKNFFTAIGDWIKEAWGNITGFFGNVGNGVKNFFGDVWGGVKSFFGFADGTDNAPRGVALVGEEGPELVRFRGGEQVIPAPQTKQILSGGNSSVFNVTFNNTQDTSAYSMMRQLKGWQKDLAFNAVL